MRDRNIREGFHVHIHHRWETSSQDGYPYIQRQTYLQLRLRTLRILVQRSNEHRGDPLQQHKLTYSRDSIGGERHQKIDQSVLEK
jgi:hypothetical protein